MAVLTRSKFTVLVSIVFISGFTQGMLLPLIAILLEQAGTSATLNGLNAIALYLGIMFVAPFVEKPLQTYGYKKIIVTGLILVTLSLFLFPWYKAFWFWFALRMIVGVGDHMLHFSTQVWVTSKSPEEKRGRNIAIYGIAFGAGFGVGPLMTRFASWNESLPFIISGAFCLLSLFIMTCIKNELPDTGTPTEAGMNVFTRYLEVLKIAWVALLPAFGYGFLESFLNGSFPVFALRQGIAVEWVSILLPSFIMGSLIFQLPLGIWSDRFGRRKVLLICLVIGFMAFASTLLANKHMLIYLVLFFIAGMFIGSLFSLGMMYLSDLLPPYLLPVGNILAGIAFSAGSMSGPLIGGTFIATFDAGAFVYAICGMLAVLFIVTWLHKGDSAPKPLKN
ncbi:putative MFS major facilitator transporter [Fictibacillus macauensis ZFHKF-1]|uniref:Putative MFS major facilitator transporter n=1 Tax=Fictibacillus macauensis ZFHKF-1 TaxID=1196324 RepID=I8UCN8_9BACL|nr:MFS transporter [Fictibacillus macauensis]EIT84690.1 putative MFS major facilitator transporter [Fictibacillus macauensis ZFHKF-1]